MLYVFHVDTGSMLTFDMNVAMQSVVHLQDAIMKRCHIPRDKQVLLISGGDNLDPTARVCSYSAGTDSNPIFLFSKNYIESATPPTTVSTYKPDASLCEQLEGCLRMHPTYETVVCRTQLALQFSDVGRDEYKACERLVHDQHLQHQGWAAVIANLDDITTDFRQRSELFLRNYDEYLTSRDDCCHTLETFGEVVSLLDKIPVLSCLTVEQSRTQSLLSWINAQDKRNTLEQMVQQCHTGLAQYDDELRESLADEISSLLVAIDNESMKEVKGLEDRLSGLEQLMLGARKLVDEQIEMAQGFVQNQVRARNLQDPSVLPDLCTSHRRQLSLMLNNHQQLQDIHRRCSAAKDELSANLHARLRWVMYIEKSICDFDNKLVIRHETLKKIRHRVEILRQISQSPNIYCQALVEVVRRRNFSQSFIQWADSLYQKYNTIDSCEKLKRQQFEADIGKHFLKALFPGFEDVPPSFISKCPTQFDNRLPPVTVADVESLQHTLPQLAQLLRFPEDELAAVLSGSATVTMATSPLVTMSTPPLVTMATLSVASGSEALFTLSSQSVEIITSQESHVFELDAMVAPPSLDLVTPPDGPTEKHLVKKQLDSVDEGQTFVTADFYIDESLPSSPATDLVTKKLNDLNSLLQEKTSELQSVNGQLVELQSVNGQLKSQLMLSESCYKSLLSLLTHSLSEVARLLQQQQQQEGELCVVDVDRALELCRCGSSEEFESLLNECRTSLNELVTKIASYTQLHTQVGQLHQQLTDQSQAVVKAECLAAELTSELNDRMCKLSSVETELQQTQLQLNQLRQQLDTQLQQAEVERQQMEKDRQQVEVERQQMEKIVSERCVEVVRELTQKHCELESIHDSTLEQVKVCQEEKKHLTEQIDSLNGKCVDMESELMKLRKCSEETRSQVSEKCRQLMVEVLSEQQELVDGAELSDWPCTMLCLGDVVNRLKKKLMKENENRHKELEQLQAQHSAKLDQLVTKHNQLVDEAKSRFEMEMVELKDKSCKQLEELVKEHETKSQELKANSEHEKKELVEKYQLETNKYSQQINDLITQHSVELEQCQAKHLQEVEILNGKWQQQVEENCVKKQQEIDLLRENIEQMKEKNELEIDEIKQKNCEEIEGLKRQVEQELGENCRKQIQEMQKKHEFEIVELNAKNEQQIETLRVKCEAEKNELKCRWTEEIEELKQQLTEMDSKLERESGLLREKYEKQIEDVKLKCQQEIEQLTLASNSNTGNTAVGNTGSIEVGNTEVGNTEVDNTGLQQQDESMPSSSHSSLKAEYDKKVSELSARLSSTAENESELELLLDDFLPLQRHQEIVTQFNKKLQALDEGRHIELEFLRTELTNQKQHDITQLINKHEQEIAELMHRHEQTINQLKKHVNKHEQDMLMMKSAEMSDSVVGASYTDSVYSRSSHVPSRSQELRRLEQKIDEMSLSQTSRELVKELVTMQSCKEGDVVLFCWEEQFGHYVACLNPDSPKHFLHHDCLQPLDLLIGSKSSIVLQITSRDYCQAKKATNRFKVPIGTKFYRVKAKAYTASAKQMTSQPSDVNAT